MPKSKPKQKPRKRAPKNAIAKNKTPEKLELIPSSMSVLEQAFEGDKELVLFFLAWMKNNRNATKAYQALNKGVSYDVASVMGCRLLRKVKNLGGIEMILEAYGVGVDKYLYQLKQGLEASIKVEICTGFDDFGPVNSTIEEPDHKTRRHYHQALGRLLGLEGAEILINNSNQNSNSNQNIIDNISDDELDEYVS